MSKRVTLNIWVSGTNPTRAEDAIRITGDWDDLWPKVSALDDIAMCKDEFDDFGGTLSIRKSAIIAYKFTEVPSDLHADRSLGILYSHKATSDVPIAELEEV